MAGKSRYKKKYKGVRYITNSLRKRYPNRYPTRALASIQATSLVAMLKASSQKITQGAAFKLLPKRVLKNPKRAIPILPDELLTPINYFALTLYPLNISRMAQVPEVYFESKIIPTGLEDLVGGFDYSYYDYFKSYVDYLDLLRGDDALKQYTSNWYVRCTEPLWDNSKKRWISRIISCDNTGAENETDYGFNPETPNGVPTGVVPLLPPTTPPPQPPKEPAKENVELLIQLEKEKQRTLLFKLYSDKMITKEMFETELKRING